MSKIRSKVLPGPELQMVKFPRNRNVEAYKKSQQKNRGKEITSVNKNSFKKKPSSNYACFSQISGSKDEEQLIMDKLAALQCQEHNLSKDSSWKPPWTVAERKASNNNQLKETSVITSGSELVVEALWSVRQKSLSQ